MEIMGKLACCFLLVVSTVCAITGAAKVGDEGEFEAVLEFIEYGLEDVCIRNNEAEWKFYTGSSQNLSQLLQSEIQGAVQSQNDARDMKEHEKFPYKNPKVLRKMGFFLRPGATLLDPAEFREYRDYSIKLQEIKSRTTIGKCADPSPTTTEASTTEKAACPTLNVRQVNKLLSSERKEHVLEDTWTRWNRKVEEQNDKTRYDFLQQLSLLDTEAEVNGEDNLPAYWLKRSEVTWEDYESVIKLWKEIIPLYNKIRQYLATNIAQNYGKDVFIDPKLIPAHVLGSLDSANWIPAAEKLGALHYSDSYQEIKSALRGKNFGDLYKMADNFTSEIKLGPLPPRFYRDSRFHVASPTCASKVVDFCSSNHELKAIACEDEDVTITKFIQVNENVMRLKHLQAAGMLHDKDEDNNGYLLREGVVDSVLYEAVAGLSSLIALNPDNLKKQNLLPNGTTPHKDEDLTSLLLSALHVIPSLPYYLSADLWRINALKEFDLTTSESDADLSSTTSGTWSYDVEKREIGDTSEEPEVGVEAGKEENDSAENLAEEEKDEPTAKEEMSIETSSDPNVKDASEISVTRSQPAVTEQPAIVKIYNMKNATQDWWETRAKLQGVGSPDGNSYADFLQDEKIIWNKPYISKFLGKILQFQLLEYFRAKNTSVTVATLQMLLQKGKSKPWQELAEDMFNITQISTEPLRKYFKPLEDFLQSGGRFQNKTPLFNPNDFKLFSQNSLTSTPENKVVEAAEGSDAVLFTLAVIAGVGLVAVIATIGRRRFTRKKRKERNKKRRILDEA